MPWCEREAGPGGWSVHRLHAWSELLTTHSASRPASQGRNPCCKVFFIIIIINSQEATSPGKRLQKLELEKCFCSLLDGVDLLGTLNMPYL